MSEGEAPFPTPSEEERQAFNAKRSLTGSWKRLPSNGIGHSVFAVNGVLV